jgi:hypothetical protein
MLRNIDLYIRAAWVLCAPLYGTEAVRQLCLSRPGIRSSARARFQRSTASPYWSIFSCWPRAADVARFRRLMGSDRRRPSPARVVADRSRHELNAPFLLYPFRETSCFFFVYVAYACLAHGVRREQAHAAWVLGAGAALLAACTIREPTALVLPGLVLGLAGLSSTWRLRLKTCGWFLLPWVIVGSIAAVVLTRVALVDISQFSVIRYLGDHDVAIAPAADAAFSRSAARSR